MKRVLCCFICLAVLCFCIGCHSKNNDFPLRTGNYYAVGNYEEMLTPYLCLLTDKKEFSFGPGSIISYAERGTYKIIDGTVIATSQTTTFQFEIEDKNTLILIDNGNNEYFKIPVNTQFVFSKDLK